MHKTKKKTKTAKLPKPIKVKKEKSDEDRLPQPMTHYIDDRLEMVKQIFNTLKPKTIVNLAPDFLKTQALEEIEEACLNELLCISTKRLKSIILATKCPTDTESSDNDSDVERHEEHISLEEISSDSEIEGSTSKKTKKKKASKVGQETEVAKKDAPNPDNADDGQISVLELLELQARARAIRSQLALEPVTKIEVDSDEEKRKEAEEKDKSISNKKDERTNNNQRKRLSSDRESGDSAKISRSNDLTDNLSSKTNEEKGGSEKRVSKKIKLKRTHRTSEKVDEIPEKINTDKQSKDKEKTTEDRERSSEKLNKDKNKTKDPLMTKIKKEKTSRSPSPDVIPIVAEPETLLITDSSDEESKKKSNEKTKNNSNETKEKEQKISETQLKEAEAKTMESLEIEKPNQLKELQKKAPINNSIDSSNENTQDSLGPTSDKDNTHDICNKEVKKSLNKTNDLVKKYNSQTNSAHHSDDDQNDDVISLGGDLESEMNEQLENEVNSSLSSYNKKEQTDSLQDNNKSQDESQQEDVISLESSGDEQANDNQSWHSRYIKSSKVNKVLAASRLGKRVRDKIKKSKHSKKDLTHENVDNEKEKSTPVFTSKHEDGSVEQYKELLEMRQRKTS